MQIKIFTIPVLDSDRGNEELNKFLRSNRILEVQQELVSTANSSYWSFCVSYIEGGGKNGYKDKKEKIDYRKVLKNEVFDKFEKLRSFRKEIAKNDAVPAYAVFIDAELAEMAKLPDISEKAINSINPYYSQFFVVRVQNTNSKGKHREFLLNKWTPIFEV